MNCPVCNNKIILEKDKEPDCEVCGWANDYPVGNLICHSCNGTGGTFRSLCSTCKGDGVEEIITLPYPEDQLQEMYEEQEKERDSNE